MSFPLGWMSRVLLSLDAGVGTGTHYVKLVKVYFASGTNGTEVIGGETYAKVYTSGRCKTDFSDVRFTASNKTTLYSYMLRSKTDSNNAVFAVNIPLNCNIAGSIYCFYGNPLAVSISVTGAFNAWVLVAPKLDSETHILSLAVLDGKLYGGTSPDGRLYEWNGVDAWVLVAPKLDSETHIYSLAVLDGKLYGGTYPDGRLYEWNGGGPAEWGAVGVEVVISFSVTDVVLPLVDSVKEGRSKDGLRTLTVSGNIYLQDETWAYLKTNFKTPLLSAVAMYEVFPVEGDSYPRISILKGDDVAVVSKEGEFDGDWVLSDASFAAVAEGEFSRLKFTLQLVQGSAHDVL